MRAVDHVVCETVRALLRLRSETAARSLVTQLVRRLEELDADGTTTFLTFLLDELTPPKERVDAAIAQYQRDPNQVTLSELTDAVESPRLDLFRTINVAPDGIVCLLNLRCELLARRQSHPELAPVERDLGYLLRSWFNRGFLELRRLDWETPAHILEKLIEYEAVHEIRGWDDLRRRLAPDRRSYGFFHPSLPDEPIIFVEVALTEGMASSVQVLLDEEPVEVHAQVDSAIFYSITNCQQGLRGISFGSFLIKQVSEVLASELPQLTTFATLSPIPGFVRWLEAEGHDVDADDESELLERCATYLIGARRGLLPLDPVARFHLRNGARIERINWRGDTSPKGLGESHGLLVNYRYSDQDLEANHDALVLDGLVIASPEVIALAGDAAESLPVTESPGEGIQHSSQVAR